MSGPSSASAGLGAGMVSRRLIVRAKDVVFVKGVIEAHDGLAHVFAESGGDLTIAAAVGRDAELDELVTDLARELGGIVDADAGDPPRG
jgi:hypothetical protein